MGKKKAILHYLENIKSKIEDIDQPDALDRILALLIQADASTRILETEKTPREFETKDYFAPAQKMKFNSDSKRHVETLEGSKSISL